MQWTDSNVQDIPSDNIIKKISLNDIVISLNRLGSAFSLSIARVGFFDSHGEVCNFFLAHALNTFVIILKRLHQGLQKGRTHYLLRIDLSELVG